MGHIRYGYCGSPNRSNGKNRACRALRRCVAGTVFSFVPNRDTAKTQHRTGVRRGRCGFLQCPEPGYRKDSAPHWRTARQVRFSPLSRTGIPQRLRAALAYGEAGAVFSNVPNRDTAKTQHRTCVRRGKCGFIRCSDTGLPQKMYKYSLNSPLKYL